MSSRPAFVAGLGVAFGLLVAMLAYALANGAIGTPPADKVGTFQEINARVNRSHATTTTTRPHARPRTAPTTTGDEPDANDPSPTSPAAPAPRATGPAATDAPTTAGPPSTAHHTGHDNDTDDTGHGSDNDADD